MKRVICLLLVIVTMMLLLSACGAFRCAICGKFIVGEKHEFNALTLFESKKMYICKTCYEAQNESN